MGHDGHEPHDHGHSASVAEHRRHAPATVAAYVITCSDTRSASSDEGGRLARTLLEGAGHQVLGSEVVKDDSSAIRQALDSALAKGARVVLLTGGTGLSHRDVTIETVTPLLEKKLRGFGELFRLLSFQEVGSAAMLSRATAGVVQGALVFAVPGSPHAVRLALERLILPELGHAVREVAR